MKLHLYLDTNVQYDINQIEKLIYRNIHNIWSVNGIIEKSSNNIFKLSNLKVNLYL